VPVTTVNSNLLSEADRARVAAELDRLRDGPADLPESVREPVLSLLRLIAAGKAASILETDRDLTSTQAAQIIGVSRPFLNKLLDEGRLPFHKTGRDRRISARDVVAYVAKRDELKRQRAAASGSYDQRRNERLASQAGMSADEASELGFG
jgi:excisionase family DNA binding protein